MMAESLRYFRHGPIDVMGANKKALSEQEIFLLPAIEQICCRHIDQVIFAVKDHTSDRVRLVLLEDQKPEAHAHALNDEAWEIRLTTGLLSLVCVLAARCVVMMDDYGIMSTYIPFFSRSSNTEEEAPQGLRFGNFGLSEAKRNAADLSPDSILDLAKYVGCDMHLLRNVVRLASTSIEFVVLHELGHFDGKHDKVRRELAAALKLPRPDAQRIFEHVADIFSLRLMLTLAMERPIGSRGAVAVGQGAEITGVQVLSYLGCSLALAAFALLQAKDTAAGSAIELVRSISGSHPLPTTRISFANRQIQAELRDPRGRKAIWPGSGNNETKLLTSVAEQSMFLAISAIQKNWRIERYFVGTGGELALPFEFFMADDEDMKKSSAYWTDENWNAARELMRNAGLRAPEDEQVNNSAQNLTTDKNNQHPPKGSLVARFCTWLIK